MTQGGGKNRREGKGERRRRDYKRLERVGECVRRLPVLLLMYVCMYEYM